ncbi:MAG: T9SS type A sorting domain-containing protein [Hymenobacter sp.]|nr:MAG: T9SS type A sorting domain-containing protein [Hymenobacter sp.]
MRKLLYLGTCLLGLTPAAQGQNAGLACGNGRYASDLFAVLPATTAVFGYNTIRDYATGSESAPVPLSLDVYQPAGDAAGQRPLVLVAFGGAFIGGARTDAEIVSICQAFARKGYVAAALDYRLLSSASLGAVYADQSKLADEVVRAAGDMKAAVRFFKRDAATANAYRIDPTKIFLGGYSAGAIMALQVAYTEAITDNPATTAAYQANGGLEGNTDLPAPDNLLPTYDATGIAGVLNIAGGVNSLGIINAGNPPLYSAQGDADSTVPYDCGPIQYTTFTVCGSHQMQLQADATGLANQLHPVPGGSHGSPVSAANLGPIIDEAAAFFQSQVLCAAAPLPVTLTSFTGQVASTDCAATLAWRTATEHNSYAYEVQASADGHQFAPLGTVPSQNRAAGASYTYRAGLVAGTRYFRLRMLDSDGSAAYSPVVALVGTCEIAPLLLVPNPVRDYALVSGLPAGRSQLLLYNGTGQRVLKVAAQGSARLILSGLPAGTYLLKVVAEDGTHTSTTRLVKE